VDHAPALSEEPMLATARRQRRPFFAESNGGWSRCDYDDMSTAGIDLRLLILLSTPTGAMANDAIQTLRIHVCLFRHTT
jgi:hypothetical protein